MLARLKLCFYNLLVYSLVERFLVTELEKFFFEAMLDGWAAGGAKQTVPGMPGYKKIVYTRSPSDGLTLVDLYCVRPGSLWSAGTTTIFRGGWPRWFMQYHGWYSAEGSSVCRYALMDAYEARRFSGGRGRHVYRIPSIGLVYRNENPSYDFGRFSGHEVVESMADPAVIHGEHWYAGGLMLDQSEIPSAE